ALAAHVALLAQRVAVLHVVVVLRHRVQARGALGVRYAGEPHHVDPALADDGRVDVPALCAVAPTRPAAALGGDLVLAFLQLGEVVACEVPRLAGDLLVARAREVRDVLREGQGRERRRGGGREQRGGEGPAHTPRRSSDTRCGYTSHRADSR